MAITNTEELRERFDKQKGETEFVLTFGEDSESFRRTLLPYTIGMAGISGYGIVDISWTDEKTVTLRETV